MVIYELVLGDVNGDPTTLLERAHEHLKDNRMTPQGFSSGHEVYDTTAVVGAACSTPTSTSMPRGRREVGPTASALLPDGWDTHGSLTVECTVWYQAIPPKWVAPMLELQGDSLIDGFRQLYAEFAPLPERIATTSFTTVIDAVDEPVMVDLRAWPNPTRDGAVRVESGQPLGDYALIDATGRTVETGQCTIPC